MKDPLIPFYRVFQKLDEKLVLSDLPGLSPKARMALLYLEDRFHEGVTVKNAASVVKMHPSSLWRLIRIELSEHRIYVTLSEYLDNLRVRKARQLLRADPSLESKQVASMVGTGVRNLELIFRTYTRMTPKEYKESTGQWRE